MEQLFCDETPQTAEACLLARGAAVIPAITELFSGQASTTQKRLAIVLGRIGDVAALPILSEALQIASLPVRVAAMRAFARIPCLESLDIIEEYKGSNNLEIARAAGEVASCLEGQLQRVIRQARADELQILPDDIRATPNQLIYSLDDLSPERVSDLAVEVLRVDGRIDRRELIGRVSQRFGRTYLIRVRQYINRFIYPAAARGELIINGSLVSIRR